MRFRSPSRIAAAVLGLLLSGSMASTALAAGDHFNSKFEFTDVQFPDGTSGIVYAGSKLSSNGEFTNCQYDSPDFQFLGQFGTEAFASGDPGTVLQFCLDHYADRS